MLALNDAYDSARVADWVELVLSLSESSFSKSKLASILRDNGADPGEAFASDVWRHLQRRASRYSQEYYTVSGDVVTTSPTALPGKEEYQLCLFFSLYGASTGTNPKLFERMSAVAINRYVGGQVFVFGWPVVGDTDPNISERMKQVSEAIKEVLTEAPASRYKDRGVDIIAWKPFTERDGLHCSNQLVVLSQCSAGHNWREKTRELPLQSWTQYFRWGFDPIVAFIVPTIIEEDLWHEICREVNGLVLDRIRLVNLLADGIDEEPLKTELAAWVIDQAAENRV